MAVGGVRDEPNPHAHQQLHVLVTPERWGVDTPAGERDNQHNKPSRRRYLRGEARRGFGACLESVLHCDGHSVHCDDDSRGGGEIRAHQSAQRSL